MTGVNMQWCELVRYLDTQRTIAMLQDTLVRIRSDALPGSPPFDAMPHGSDVGDKTARVAIEAQAIEAKIKELSRVEYARRKEIEKYTDGIKNQKIRFALRLRFLSGLTWGQVAELVSDEQSEESIRKQCRRYVHGGGDNMAKAGRG